jgi:hypothetical protein
VAHQKRQVEQHPDGDEENPIEDVPEGKDLGGDLVDIDRLGDHHPGKERPHRQREPPPPGDPRRPEDEAQNRHRQYFPAVEPDHFLEEERDHETRRQQDDPHADARLDQGEGHGGKLRRLPLPERGDQQHHRDHGHVLEQEDPDGDLPVGAVQLHPVGVHLQDDRGARKGQDEPDEGRFRQVKSRDGKNNDGEQDRRRELHPPALQDPAAHHAQVREGDLQPDGEQQEGDADLGEGIHHPRLGHQPRPGRAEDGACDQERRHDGQVEPPEYQRNGGGDRQDDGQVAKDQGQVDQRVSRGWLA